MSKKEQYSNVLKDFKKLTYDSWLMHAKKQETLAGATRVVALCIVIEAKKILSLCAFKHSLKSNV